MNDGHKRQGQKHQNKAAFKIMFNPLALDTHKKVSYKGYALHYSDYASDAQNNFNGRLSIISTKG